MSGQALGKIPERVVGLAKIPSSSGPVSMAREMESPSLAGLEPCVPSVSSGRPNIPIPKPSLCPLHFFRHLPFPRVSQPFRLNGKARAFYNSTLHSPDHLFCGRRRSIYLSPHSVCVHAHQPPDAWGARQMPSVMRISHNQLYTFHNNANPSLMASTSC